MPFETHVVDERTRFIEDVHCSAQLHGGVRALRDQSGNRLQVAEPMAQGRAVGLTRHVEPAQDVSVADTAQCGRGDPRGPTHAGSGRLTCCRRSL